MKCWNCGAPMIWGNDFSYEDYGYLSEEGIISTFSCSNCDRFGEFYHPLDDEEEEE